MKQLLMLGTAILFFINVISAQLNFSTDKSHTYMWKQTKLDWDLLDVKDDDTTLFVVDTAFTVFKKITPAKTTVYYIKSKSKVKAYDDQYVYQTVDDEGNKCAFSFHLKRKMVQCIYTAGIVTYANRHRIKAAW